MPPSMKIDEAQKNKLLDVFLLNFNLMPNWLKNTLIVALICAIVYFGWIQKQIVYNKEKSQMIEIQYQLESITKKIKFLEAGKEDEAEISENMSEIRDMFAVLERVERKRSSNMMKLVRKLCKDLGKLDSYEEFIEEDERINNEYQEEMNNIFDEHLKNRILDRKEKEQELAVKQKERGNNN